MSDTRYNDGTYAEQNPDWHARDAQEKARAVVQLIDMIDYEPTSILDVGCGRGHVLVDVKRRLDETGRTHIAYTGWDLSFDAIERCPTVAGMEFRGGNMLVSNAWGDVVLCVDTFEHVGNDVGWLRRLREHGRMFVFRIPLDLSALDVVRPKHLLSARKDFGHKHAYTRELALQVLEEAGFNVLFESYHRVPLHDPRPRQRLTDGVRSALFTAHPHRAVRLLGGYSLMVIARP
jgi:SAM-dependent methyltransferase